MRTDLALLFVQLTAGVGGGGSGGGGKSGSENRWSGSKCTALEPEIPEDGAGGGGGGGVILESVL